jgi:hypothetical protein
MDPEQSEEQDSNKLVEVVLTMALSESDDGRVHHVYPFFARFSAELHAHHLDVAIMVWESLSI